MNFHKIYKRKRIKKFFEVIQIDGNRMIFKSYSIDKIKKFLDKYQIEYTEIKEFKNIYDVKKCVNYTVQELKDYIKNLPNHLVVLYERIEDFYFKKNEWNIVPIYQSEVAPSYSEFVPVFTPFVDVDNKYLCLTAHY